MIGVVNDGTGRQMQLANGIQAAAKTGTAQLNGNGPAGEVERLDHRLRPGGQPEVRDRRDAQGGQDDEISASTGGRLAGPIAKAVLDYMFANNIPTPSHHDLPS